MPPCVSQNSGSTDDGKHLEPHSCSEEKQPDRVRVERNLRLPTVCLSVGYDRHLVTACPGVAPIIPNTPQTPAVLPGPSATTTTKTQKARVRRGLYFLLSPFCHSVWGLGSDQLFFCFFLLIYTVPDMAPIPSTVTGHSVLPVHIWTMQPGGFETVGYPESPWGRAGTGAGGGIHVCSSWPHASLGC